MLHVTNTSHRFLAFVEKISSYVFYADAKYIMLKQMALLSEFIRPNTFCS